MSEINRKVIGNLGFLNVLKKINNEKVELVPMVGMGEDKRPVRGEALFPELYANIFLCARKNSGKTSLIYTILKKCCGRDTKVLAFVSTLFKDQAWLGIQDYARKKGIYFEGHTSLIDVKSSARQEKCPLSAWTFYPNRGSCFYW